MDADGHDDVAAAACTGSKKCLQDLADHRAAGVDKAVKFFTSPVGVGLLELTAAAFTAGGTLEATEAGKAIVGVLSTSGLLVRGTSDLLGAATGQDPKQVSAGTSAVGVATNPVSLTTAVLTNGVMPGTSMKVGAAAGSAFGTVKIAMDPAKAAQEPAKTALTVRGAVNSVTSLFSIFFNPPAPPSPAPPKVPDCAGSSCR